MAGTATPSVTTDSNNQLIDGILWNRGWTSAGSGPTTISVYIAGRSGDETVSLVGQTIMALGSVSDAEVSAMQSAMAAIEAVANVRFVSVNSQASADIIWASIGSADADGALGWANPPGTAWSNVHGDFQSVVTVNRDAYSGALSVGSFDYVTFIHELGHAMGLAHPHDTGGSSGIFPGVTDAFGDLGTHNLNQGIFTTMTYNDGWQTAPHGGTPSSAYGNQAMPMAIDIAALQYIYGANTTTNAGNTVYTLPGSNGPGTSYAAIWDTGGTDTIIGSASRGNVIDLRAATLQVEVGGGGFVSHASGVHGGFTVARGVVIENATGGSADDIITGNQVANILNGRGGSDRIDGGNGNDVILGGGGHDMLTGGTGSDTLLGGAGRDNLAGGSSDDIIAGGLGRDVITGGAGHDIFRFIRVADSRNGHAQDTIVDFDGRYDRIDLSAIDADRTASGAQTFSWLGGRGFSGEGGELRFAGGVLIADVDGDRDADLVIRLTGVRALALDDFLL
jgi:serralysin